MVRLGELQVQGENVMIRSRKKAFHVDECIDCIFFAIQGDDDVCTHPGVDIRKIEDAEEIPDWCPLPDWVKQEEPNRAH